MSTKTKTTTAVSIPPPTSQEIALQQRILDLADVQLREVERQAGFTAGFLESLEPLFAPLVENITAALAELPAADDTADAAARAEAQEELLNRQLEMIRSGVAPSPREAALIQRVADAAIATGTSDIERAAGLQIESIREELGPSLGLRPGDTPLIDRGARVGSEAVRSIGDLTTAIRGQQAQALLDRPFQTSGLIQGQQTFLESIRQFQAQLQESAFLNRLNLTGGLITTGGQLGLGLATGVPVNVPGAAQGLAAQRVATPTTTVSTSQSGPGQFLTALTGIGKLAGGAGAALSGIAAVSSRDAKDGKEPVDEDQILEAMRSLPVEFWHYLDDVERKHIGPYAEDFQERFGVGDGTTIHFIDALGVLTAAIKAVDRKVSEKVPEEDTFDLGLPGNDNIDLGLKVA